MKKNKETKNYTVQSSKTVKIEDNEKEEQKIIESKTSNNENYARLWISNKRKNKI